jgi:NADH-quinone oxidoreductase subunit L
LVAGTIGIALAYLAYMFVPAIPALVVKIFKPLHALFFRKWFFDELYHLLFVKTSHLLGLLFFKTDKNVVDRFGPDGSAAASVKVAGILSRFQSGYVYQYVFVMVIAVIGLISWFFFKNAQALGIGM